MYRPITLLSVVEKATKKIIAGRLLKHYDEKSLIRDKQYGFRNGRWTEDTIRKQMEHVSSMEQKYILIVFVQFSCVHHTEDKDHRMGRKPV